jgi:TetR/AcrR family transcriptional regulator, cholesterol catabolism regulator
MPRSLKTPRRGRQREILTAFTELVAARGYDAASLADVAARLDLSKGTILHHYGTKERLLRQMSLGYMERRIRELELICEAYEGAAQRLAAVITAIVSGFRDDGPATRAFSREFMRFVDDPVMEDVRVARAEYMRIVTGIVTEGAWRGELRATNPTVTALQLIGMCNWGWTWVDPAGPLSVEELAAAFVATFLDGLRATSSSEPVRAELPQSVRQLRANALGEA